MYYITKFQLCILYKGYYPNLNIWEAEISNEDTKQKLSI